MYFTDGRMRLHREAIGPKACNCFSSGVRTNISKETYSHLWFSRGWGSGPPALPFLSLDPPMFYMLSGTNLDDYANINKLNTMKSIASTEMWWKLAPLVSLGATYFVWYEHVLGAGPPASSMITWDWTPIQNLYLFLAIVALKYTNKTSWQSQSILIMQNEKKTKNSKRCIYSQL